MGVNCPYRFRDWVHLNSGGDGTWCTGSEVGVSYSVMQPLTLAFAKRPHGRLHHQHEVNELMLATIEMSAQVHAVNSPFRSIIWRSAVVPGLPLLASSRVSTNKYNVLGLWTF